MVRQLEFDEDYLIRREGLYRDYTGGNYIYLTSASADALEDMLVIYKSLDDGLIFCIPSAEFNEWVDVRGMKSKTVNKLSKRRFQLIRNFTPKEVERNIKEHLTGVGEVLSAKSGVSLALCRTNRGNYFVELIENSKEEKNKIRPVLSKV